VPTAIAWGSNDPFVSPESVARLRSSIHGSTLDIVEGAGHFLPEESAERVVSVVCDLITR
jgi:pimeloyl-ACP methyl ester carboxylesterase